MNEIALSPSIQNEAKERVRNLSEFQQYLSLAQSKTISELVDFLLATAVILDVSDLHMEPENEVTKIRLRIDGMLHDAGTIPPALYQEVLSRIKLLSHGIKLNVTDRPQDGRFSFALDKEHAIEARVSALPAEYGEAIVIRILNPAHLVDLENLGLRKDLLQMFKSEIGKPNGMIVVTGPTGCGKTTTLYAFLKALQKPELKIITIEDPIEYHLNAISQTQVNPAKGYDFANGLQAIVRQDPDIIFVGEVRDNQTAEIALQAALTGHLVFTTLHTNNAAGTIPRLLSLGAQPSLIAPALTMAIAQRLVRRVCQQCKMLISPDQATRKQIEDALKKLNPNIRPKISSQWSIPQAKGCEQCNGTGYRGRIGIFEAFRIDEKMEPFLAGSPSIGEIQRFTVRHGMIPMRQNGIMKVLEGITTMEEVEREAPE
ncbi:MAG: type II/IV secretion system protein [Candidatus Wildermuthbacteria bacterium]|nr:type II/IV secretion system protein [Candidatus Wildermuthbacteria bacterium]